MSHIILDYNHRPLPVSLYGVKKKLYKAETRRTLRSKAAHAPTQGSDVITLLVRKLGEMEWKYGV